MRSRHSSPPWFWNSCTNSEFRIPNSELLEWPRDASIFSHPPEVHRHQHGNPERQADAVQHVEPQQRAFPDERPTEQGESCIVVRMNQRHVAEPEQHRSGTLMTKERRRTSHVRTDG